MIDLVVGTIKFATMTAVKTNKDGVTLVRKIRRTVNNKRQRPQAQMRHQDGGRTLAEFDSLNLLNGKHLEWLAWNWRLKMNE